MEVEGGTTDVMGSGRPRVARGERREAMESKKAGASGGEEEVMDTAWRGAFAMSEEVEGQDQV